MAATAPAATSTAASAAAPTVTGEAAIDPRAALASLPHAGLPAWLAAAIDLISDNVAAFPPPSAAGFEFLDHLYPH